MKKDKENLIKLQNMLLSKLEWGTKIDFNRGFTPLNDRDIWCGQLNEDISVEIAGNFNSPYPKHVESLIEFIENFNIYESMVPYKLGYGEDEWQVSTLCVTNPENPMEWEIELISYYGAEIAVEFSDRKLIPFGENYFDKIKRLIRANLNEKNCPDFNLLEEISDLKTYNSKLLGRTLYPWLKEFNEEDLISIIDEVWEWEIIVKPENKRDLDRLELKTIPVLKNIEIRCPSCSLRQTVDLLLKIGNYINYPEYSLKNEVKWSCHNYGSKEYEDLYLSAISTRDCSCGEEISTLVRYKENTLAEICPDKSEQVEYGPWLGRSYIKDELIELEEYERKTARELIFKIENINNNKIIEKTLNESRKLNISRHPSKNEAYCYSKFRNSYSFKEKEKLDNFFGLKFLNSSIKSVSLLKEVSFFCPHCKKEVREDFWFYWGDLLDFQEYNIGDEIRWSNYNMGDKKYSVVYAVANPLFKHVNCVDSIQILIKIRENQIVGTEFLDSYYHKIKAYTGCEKKAFLWWPDDEFQY